MRKAMPFFSVLWLIALSAAAQPQQQAALHLPAIFGDNMVLQRGIAVPVWGTAVPGDTLNIAFNGQKKTATADQNGKWMVKLDAMQAGGPFDLTVAGKTTVTYKNVVIGEVWVCSGQSNMEFTLGGAHNAKEVIPASANPMLRHFNLKKAISDAPLSDCAGNWEEADPKTSGHFTAVGYFFGAKLQKDLNVPVGLIHTSWGGTIIEAWTSMPNMQNDPDFAPIIERNRANIASFPKAKADFEQNKEKLMAAWREAAAKAKAESKPAPRQPQGPQDPAHNPNRPAVLYNGMIAPVVPHGIAGAIWYQGESNAGNSMLYRKEMPLMIKNWRTDFGQEIPFFIVSLANFMARADRPTDTDWARLREAQAMATTALPKVGIALAIDVGDAKDIHPKDKQTVGERLALNALAIAYGKSIEYSGPVYDTMKKEGDKIRLTFKHTGTGLAAKGEKIVGFAIAGEDKNFVWADATIDGNTVLVSSKDVPSPVAVRYAWADNPECNLYNKEGLPTVPFRTDDWPKMQAAPKK